MVPELRDQLLNEEHQEATAQEGQKEVVNLEQSVQLEWLAIPHKFTAAKDHNHV